MANVRMVERRNDLGFLIEALAEAIGAHLERHLALEPLIGGAIDLTHAAGGDERVDPVRTQDLARLQRNR